MYMEIALTPIIEIIKVQPTKTIMNGSFQWPNARHVLQRIMSKFVFTPRMLAWMSMITSVIIRYLLWL